MITVLVADDHPLIREGVRRLLGRRASTRVVAETGSGTAAVDLAAELGPDIAVIDLSLPDMSGFEVIRQLKVVSPQTRAIVLSAHGELAFAARSFALGARAFVVKDKAPEGLLAAIDATLAGRSFARADFDVDQVNEYLRRSGGGRSTDVDRLTPREREVFEHVVAGRTSAEIGELLGISRRTVEGHRAQLQRKLDVEGTAGLVRFAYEHGLRPAGTDQVVPGDA